MSFVNEKVFKAVSEDEAMQDACSNSAQGQPLCYFLSRASGTIYCFM